MSLHLGLVLSQKGPPAYKGNFAAVFRGQPGVYKGQHGPPGVSDHISTFGPHHHVKKLQLGGPVPQPG